MKRLMTDHVFSPSSDLRDGAPNSLSVEMKAVYVMTTQRRRHYVRHCMTYYLIHAAQVRSIRTLQPCSVNAGCVVMRWFQLRWFDFDSTGVRRSFDRLSEFIKVTV